MNTISINSSGFEIYLKLEVFESDVQYSSNTIMNVNVNSMGFCAVANMDIDIKQLAKFADDFNVIYSTLNGSAEISEPYGEHQFIKFYGDGYGHINIKGHLSSCGMYGFVQELDFENNIDQTCLSEFATRLSEFCKLYI